MPQARWRVQLACLAGALGWLLPGGMPGVARALTLPVEHEGGLRATASYVEDHEGWHSGIDLPASHGASQVRAAGDETLFKVYNLALNDVQVVLGDNPTVDGPWELELSDTRQKYMLDILKVKRVTPGKPEIEYQVSRVIEVQPGIALDEVELVPNFPSPGDSLVAGDQFEVDYAYYSSRIFEVKTAATVGEPFRAYAHIDHVHDYVDWNSYPATPQNRFYGTDSGIPVGRWPRQLVEGVVFADIETILDFASEPHHLHFGLASAFNFPGATVNPLSSLTFPIDDPQGSRPYVRSLAFLSGVNGMPFPNPTVYGQLSILAESRDDMGSPENADDGDGPLDTIRQAGAYNAGYWITAPVGFGEDVASESQPNTVFAGNGKDDLTNGSPLATVLVRDQPFFVDINTNYHLVVSHVEEDATRFWNTRAQTGHALNDGSDAPEAQVNSDARFPDGRYTVHAKARDVVGWGAPEDSLVVVDNFRPFVQKVVVRDDSGELYSGEWTFDGSEIIFSHADPDDGMRDALGRKRCADGRSDVVIEVTFSEAMKAAAMSSIDPLGFTPTLERMPASQDLIWAATVPKAKLKTKKQISGRQFLEFYGEDWAGNDVRQITTPAAIDPADNSRDGAVMRGPSGADELHRFAICQSLALVVDVTGSMYDEIEDVKEAMGEVIDYNEAHPSRFPSYHIVIFEDDVLVRLSSRDAEETRAVLNNLQAGFGGACPEASVAALDSLAHLMPGGGVAVLATDADPLEGRPRLDAAKERLRALGIEVNTLLSGSCESFLTSDGQNQDSGHDQAVSSRADDPAEGANRERTSGPGGPTPISSELFDTIDARIAFSEVSRATGGLYVESFPNPDFVDAVRMIAQRLPLGATVVARDIQLTPPAADAQTIAVDQSCDELLVLLNHVIFDQTSLALRRPSGEIVLPGDPDVRITYATGLASYLIDDPAPGNWSAEVTCLSGQGRFALTAMARTPHDLDLGGAATRRAGTSAPLTVDLGGSGAPTAFRLLRPDGSTQQLLTLFDDGFHQDGEAGDRVWGATVAIEEVGEYRVGVEGLDAGLPFSRETARTLVVGLPEISTPDTLAVGQVEVGRTTTRLLRVKNSGVAPLTVASLTVAEGLFAFTPGSFTVPAGDAQRVEVTWTPLAVGSIEAMASIASDDPDTPTHQLLFRGEAVPPADLAFVPDTLEIAIAQGDSTVVAFSIRNDGEASAGIVLFDPATDSGPPDTSYRYRTAYGPGAGVPFRWVPLGPEAATLGPLPVDGAAGPFPIGFELDFYGAKRSEFYISENGHITLGGLPSLSPYFYGPCPPGSYFAPYIAPYLENLDLRHSGRIRWHADGERLVVEYQDARRYDRNELAEPLNCQIVVTRDGSIDFNYESVPPTDFPLTPPLVAIGSGSNDESLAPSCEIPFPARERTTLHFWRENPWLEFSAPADTVGTGDSLLVSVRTRAALPGFEVGESYTAHLDLAVAHYDAARSGLPVRLTILPGPHSLSGRVTAAEDGLGVAGAEISAVGPYGAYHATTNGSGDYALPGLPAGAYVLTATSPLFGPAEAESVQVPAAAPLDFALVRPIIELDPPALAFTLTSGDSLCLPLVIRNPGTAPLALTGIRRGETPPGLTGPAYERVLDDPRFDSEGPDLVSLDAARGSTQIDFRLSFADTLGSVPPYAFISLDVDRDPGTGANPPAFGYGLATQSVGAEYELAFDNVCSNFIYLFDAVSGAYLSGYYMVQEDPRTVSFTVPLADLGADDGIMNLSVTSLPGICDGGSRRPAAPEHRSAGESPRRGGGGQTLDWMPETGHGTVGSCAWLSLDPSIAIVAPGDSILVSVCVDASALTDTTVGCSVSLESNDPRRPLAVLSISATITSTVEAESPAAGAASLAFALEQNDPNPFVRGTRIRFSLPREERVRLAIYDLSGRLVHQILDERRPAGEHRIDLARERLSSGVYLYRLESGGRTATRR
ncbi:MAG: carboxypeptidase regulatory-like domain-containing protein [Candidatus Eisenbacteria bacterium]|nr:carboxypeptidase regulatory-like domain-containing protein [Candidatus Eisenbacteria bacterium]